MFRVFTESEMDILNWKGGLPASKQLMTNKVNKVFPGDIFHNFQYLEMSDGGVFVPVDEDYKHIGIYYAILRDGQAHRFQTKNSFQQKEPTWRHSTCMEFFAAQTGAHWPHVVPFSERE